MAAELVNGLPGIGGMVKDAANYNNTPVVLVGIIAIGISGLIIDGLLLRLERADGPDPAYAGLPLDAALRYGPRLLRNGDPVLRRQVWADIVRLSPVAAPGRPAHHELAVARVALSVLNRL